MGTFTAQILVGHPHQNHSGIIPSHALFLSENSTPAWVLVPQQLFKLERGKRRPRGPITWIPSAPDYILEDAFLMIGIHILKHRQLATLAKQCIVSENPDRVFLYEVDAKHLDEMRGLCRTLDIAYKIVITVLEGTSIAHQLGVLEDYQMDVEVCMMRYKREYSVWGNSTTTSGSLSLPDPEW
jgi:hypothetical protein